MSSFSQNGPSSRVTTSPEVSQRLSVPRGTFLQIFPFMNHSSNRCSAPHSGAVFREEVLWQVISGDAVTSGKHPQSLGNQAEATDECRAFVKYSLHPRELLRHQPPGVINRESHSKAQKNYRSKDKLKTKSTDTEVEAGGRKNANTLAEKIKESRRDPWKRIEGTEKE